jgi:site-specific DNA recombinase
VGQHPGIIPGKVWVQVQESLERNKLKAYHKPRNNEAVLTGLLFCSCGSRMYPKLSKRKTADGKPIYTYVCKMKERSKRSVCNRRNANGNTLDIAIVEQIKLLGDDQGTFIDQLEKSRSFYTGNRGEYEDRLAKLRQERADTEKKVEGLVDSLADLEDGGARKQVAKRLEQLNGQCREMDAQINELEGLTSQHALSDIEFDVMRQLLSVFKSSIDEMTIEQKRSAVRTLVRKVVWDGVNAHVVLFGASEDEIEYPEIGALGGEAGQDEEPNDELVPFGDVNYDEDDQEDDCLGKNKPLSGSKTHWGEDSK